MQSQGFKSSKGGGAHNSLPGWEFMQAGLGIEIKQQERCTQLTL